MCLDNTVNPTRVFRHILTLYIEVCNTQIFCVRELNISCSNMCDRKYHF